MKMLQVIFFTNFLLHVSGAFISWTSICTGLHCFRKFSSCFFDRKCKEVLDCVANCKNLKPQPKMGRCPYDCGLYNTDKLLQLIQCQADNKCIPGNSGKKITGICLGSDNDAIKDSDVVTDLLGKWWVLKGQNCDQDAIWKGGYDDTPCNTLNFYGNKNRVTLSTSFCFGIPAKGECDSQFYKFKRFGKQRDDRAILELVTKKGPFVIQPHNNIIRVVSFPNKNWAMLVVCQTTPIIEINSLVVISRFRSLEQLDDSTKKELINTASNLGVDFNKMCNQNAIPCKN